MVVTCIMSVGVSITADEEGVWAKFQGQSLI